jgi:hypothetical protein
LGSYEIGVKGTNQGRTATATLTVNVVQDDPTANPPVASLLTGVNMALTATQVRIAWSPATDPTSAIAGYEVERSRDGGVWGAATSVAAPHLETSFSLMFGATYRFRIRAIDAAGNWSPWVEAVDPTFLTPVDDRSSQVVRGGTWHRTSSASAFRTTETGSITKGARATMTFTGHGVALVGPTNPLLGDAQVYVDGVYVRTISMRSAASTSRHVVFAASFPGGGRHSISLVVIGKGAHPLFRVDAFVVLK